MKESEFEEKCTYHVPDRYPGSDPATPADHVVSPVLLAKETLPNSLALLPSQHQEGVSRSFHCGCGC